MDSLLSIGASIASICGALLAFYQAKLSEKHATKAEAVRDELVQRREMVEISQVHSETTRILRVVSKVGPTCTESTIRGVNCADIAKEVEEYSRFLNEQSSHFSEFFDNEASRLCTELNEDIELLSEATGFEEKKNIGKKIYHEINGFMPILKRFKDELKERKPNS